MYFASFGPPPDNPDNIRLMTLHDFIDLQGKKPKKWAVKPYCPHCKTEELHTYDVKGAMLGFRLNAADTTEHKASPGFHHHDKAAKPDCPYSYDDDPRYKHSHKGIASRKKEIEHNKQHLKNPKVAAANEHILKFLLYRLTGQEVMSPSIRKLADAAADFVVSTPGLATHPWLEPYFQAKSLATFFRTFSHAKQLSSAKEEIALPLNLETSSAVPSSSKKRQPPKPPLREVTYQNIGSQNLKIIYKGRERLIIVPQRLRLCTVHRKDGKVTFVPILSGKKKQVVDFEVSARFAQGIVALAEARIRKRAIQAERTQKLPGYKDRPFQSRLPRKIIGQGNIL